MENGLLVLPMTATNAEVVKELMEYLDLTDPNELSRLIDSSEHGYTNIMDWMEDSDFDIIQLFLLVADFKDVNYRTLFGDTKKESYYVLYLNENDVENYFK